MMDTRGLLLEVSVGPRRGRKAVLAPGTSLKVGRSSAADFVIAQDPQLSAAHFELRWDGSRATIRDLRGTAGTRLDGDLVVEAEVAHGAWIRAGETDFTVYVEGHTPPPLDDDDDDDHDDDVMSRAPEAPPFAEEAQEPSPEDDEAAESAEEREYQERFRQTQAVQRRTAQRAQRAREEAATRAGAMLAAAARREPLYAILDAARTPRILEVLHEAREESRSLYEGTAGEALDEVAPRLVRLEAGSRLLAQLTREGWGRRWGVFAEGDVAPKDLRRHLRRFLMVEDDETGERLYFRFYDPVVLRDFWPTCSPRQLEDLMGPLRAFLVEGERGEILRLTADGAIEPWSGEAPEKATS